MEAFVILWTVLAVLAVTFLAVFNSFQLSFSRKGLPPGSLGWPLIGESLALIKSMNSKHPDTFERERRNRYGRMFLSHLFGHPTIVMTTYEAAKHVLSREDLFKVSYPYSVKVLIGHESVIMVNGEKHERLRKLMTPFFLPDSLKDLISPIEEQTMNVLKSWEGQVRDVPTMVRTLTLGVVCKVFLGPLSDEELEPVLKDFDIVRAGVMTAPVNLPGTNFRRAIQARKRICAHILKIIYSKVDGEPCKKLLTTLQNAPELDGGAAFSEQQIVDNFFNIVIAGLDTTANNLICLLWALHENVELQEQLRDEQMAVRERLGPDTALSYRDIKEMDVLQKVINEGLRMTLSPFCIFREATKDVTYKGFNIPKGMRVDSSILSMHYDPEIYPNPYEFDISRWQKQAVSYLPFGYGVKTCVGSELGRLEIAIFLHHLTTKYRWESQVPLDVQYFPMIHFKQGFPALLRPL
ncbi:hypothetical protein Mapa_012744 [Marchantia paleacea]|nr:hypothetical protein Mapa_012744 [Marchantia paleacea]